MRAILVAAVGTFCLAGCTTNTSNAQKDPRTESTNTLCRALVTNPDPSYREQVAAVLTARGATPERCYRMIQADNAIVTGIAIAGAATAVGVAASNGGYGGGHYPPAGAYGVAWDQFYNQYYQPIWRCRDRATGRFVDDYRCAGMPMHDGTWPGWSA